MNNQNNTGGETDWRRTLLRPTATLGEAIHSLNDVGAQIVLAVSGEGVLLGTVTDGDIRQGLLRGMTLDNPIDPIIHRSPFVVPPQMTRSQASQLMLANKVHQLPIVDEKGRVVGLHLWDQLATPPVRSNLMVIMAGGFGTRLLPLTENCPKPLLPIAGKPMLEHIIERAKSEGFNQFVLAIHHLGSMIEEYFGNGASWQVQIDYLREPRPLGTAGALGLIEAPPEQALIVTNGDVLTDIRYGELLDFHMRNAASASMAVRLHEWQHPYGVVSTQGVDIIGIEEKPTFRTQVNAGIYALAPEALDQLKAGEPCDMPELFDRLRLQGRRTVVYPMHEPWLDVGKPTDLQLANDAAQPRASHSRK